MVHVPSEWCLPFKRSASWLYIYLLAVPDSICLGRGGKGNKALEFKNKKKRDGDR